MGFGSADYLHLFLEAKKLAFADRAWHYFDPDFGKPPVERLISKEYARERAKLINMHHAAVQVGARRDGNGPQIRRHDLPDRRR